MRAEARADRLEERHQLARLEMLAAVEGHVLEKVREAALIGVLLDRAGVDGEAHRDAIGRTLVLADEIAEAVRQPPGLHRRIDRQRAIERELRRNRRLRRAWLGRRRRGRLRQRRGDQRENRNTEGQQ